MWNGNSAECETRNEPFLCLPGPTALPALQDDPFLQAPNRPAPGWKGKRGGKRGWNPQFQQLKSGSRRKITLFSSIPIPAPLELDPPRCLPVRADPGGNWKRRVQGWCHSPVHPKPGGIGLQAFGNFDGNEAKTITKLLGEPEPGQLMTINKAINN